MNRNRDCRGRFSRLSTRSVNPQGSFRPSNPNTFRPSSTEWNCSLSPKKRGKNHTDTLNNKSLSKHPDIPTSARGSTGISPKYNSNHWNSGLNQGRKLPPPPSSPPPLHRSLGMSSSSGNAQSPPGEQNDDLNSNSNQSHSLDKDAIKEHDNEGKAGADDTPLTAATLEAVIGKSMTKVFGKLDTLSKDLKKVQDSQAATVKLAGEVKLVQTEVKRIDETVAGLHKLAVDNSSSHDSLLEEVRLLQAQTRDHSLGSQSPEAQFEFLKMEARSLRNNLILEGIPELSEISEEEAKTILTTDDQVISFFDKSLGISKLDIDSIYRLGQPRQDPTSARPILVKFQRPREREAVWRARSLLGNGTNSTTHIKEDLPPKLRPLMTSLLKVAQQAKRFPKAYRNVMVRDFKVHVNGKAYSPYQLEDLPKKLKPSYSSTPGNIEAVAFYGRHSIFSNHFLCNFSVGDIFFNSIEQFLAYRRATIAGDSALAQDALNSMDPVDSKKILTTLKTAQSEDTWLEKRHDVLFSGLYAKFTQNQPLMNYLLDSESRQLGKASRDLTWGIGLTLTHKRVLDTSLWKGNNLLGKTLMEVRQDIFDSIYPPKSPEKQKSVNERDATQSSTKPPTDQDKDEESRASTE